MPILALDASGYTRAYSMENFLRLCVQIEVASGDADGDFYVVARADSTAAWVRTALTVAKAPASALVAKLDWPTRCGAEVAVEWVRSAGGAGQTANIWIQADATTP